jgi:hypothetical protein
LSIIASQPQTLNLASELNFYFTIMRAPSVTYFCQDVAIPNVSLPPAKIPGPSLMYPVVGDHLVYSNLNLSFKVDENLQNYLEILNWLVGIGDPTNTGSQYSQLEKNKDYSGYGIYSDLQLFTLDTQKNTKYVITFEKCSPISLSGPKYGTKDATVNYITSNVEFSYRKFHISLP